MFKQLISSYIRRLLSSIGFSDNDFIKNTSWVSISTILGSVMSYFLIILITRFLGVKGLGQYSFMFAFVGFFFLFSDLGLSFMMIKDLSRNFKNVSKYVSNILNFKILFLSLSLFVYLIFLFFINKQEILFSLILVGIYQFISQFGSFATSILRIKNSGKKIALGIFFERLFSFIVGGFVLFYFNSLFLFVFVLLLSQLLKILFYFFNIKKYFKYSLSLDWSFVYKLIKQGYPFILAGVFTLIYARMDTVMLSFMQGDLVTGWYNAAYKLINVLTMVPVMLLTFGFPLFSKLFAKNKVALRKLLESLLNFSLVIIFPAIVGVFFLSSRLLLSIYGFTMPESQVVLKILIVVSAFIFLTEILGLFIAAVDKQIVFAKITGFGALINIVLNFILIPRYSLYGAAIATGLTYFFMFIWMYFYVQQNVLKFSLFKKTVSPFLASIGLVLLVPFLLNFNLFLIILFSVIFYFALFFLIDFFMKKLFDVFSRGDL